MTPKWTESQTSSVQTATLEVEGYRAEVRNLDDDLSKYTILAPSGETVAYGASAIGDHFAACKAAAWALLQDHEGG